MKNKKLSGAAVVWIALLSAWFIYAILCGLGLTKTFWGVDASLAGWGWKIIMGICLLIAAAILIKWARGRIQGQQYTGLFVGFLIALGMASSTGFKFTAGDIKQTVTCFQNPDGKPSLNGKVNPDCLKKYYNDFYQFDTDTALWNYVVTYNELPGVNHWAFNIREGKTPPSTAPRANEDFKYHTGAYEMDLSK